MKKSTSQEKRISLLCCSDKYDKDSAASAIVLI